MTATEHYVTTEAEATALPTGTWVIAADATEACLFETHFGLPQRMWGVKSNDRVRWFDAMGSLPLPLYVTEVIEPEGYVCPHAHTNECGQCHRCGKPDVGERRPLFFDEQGMDVFRAAAEANSRIMAAETEANR